MRCRPPSSARCRTTQRIEHLPERRHEPTNFLGIMERVASMRRKLVVVGAGMASGRMLEHLFKALPDAYDVTLFGAEPRGNYNRIMLSPVLAGEATFDEIVIHDAAWYAAHGVACRFGETVMKIDRAAESVHSRNGETPYARLGIATGSAPFIISVGGKGLQGGLSFRAFGHAHA